MCFWGQIEKMARKRKLVFLETNREDGEEKRKLVFLETNREDGEEEKA